MDVLRVYWASIKHLNHRGYIYVWANLLWIALTILIVTAPAAWAGLMVLTHRSHTRIRVSLDDFWEGFKQHFWRATLNGIITALIFIINISNLLSYTPVDWFGNLLAMVWFLTLLIWMGIQLYLWAIIEEMENPSLWLAYRNALLMVIRNPVFTLGLFPFVFFLLIIGIAIPPFLLLLSGSGIAILGVSGTLNRLRAAGFANPSHHTLVDDHTQDRYQQNHSRTTSIL